MNYEECLNYIHSVKWQGHKPGLERTQELLRLLGNPEKQLKFIHVAGTNGKGSTCAMLASVLQKSGYKTGLYTSPFIHRFNDRMQINGKCIPDEKLVALIEKIRPLADEMADTPTEFEVITALGMLYFACEKCDVVVLEVGLGGTLDSTNVIPCPEVAVITSLGLDHTSELGSSMAKIANAKAGIIKNGADVVFYGSTPEAEIVIENTCKQKNARLTKVDFNKLSLKRHALDGIVFDFAENINLNLPLLGTYQPKNAAVALTAIEVLRNKGWKISQINMKDGIANVNWQGRFEIICQKPMFILDGSHNTPGLYATIQSLKTYFENQKFVFVLSVMADKNYDEMLEMLKPIAKHVLAVKANIPRALSAQNLAQAAQKHGINATECDSIYNAAKIAIQGANDDIICALGTLYFSEDIRQSVNKIVENKY